MNVASKVLSRLLSLRLFACVGLFGLAPFAVAQQAGSLDAGFAVSEAANDVVYAVTPQSDGKILVGGDLRQFAGTANMPVLRLLNDGELDTSFTPAGIESYNTLTDSVVKKLVAKDFPIVFAVSVQADGKVLVGGSFFFVNGKSGYGGLIRLKADGTLDKSFAALRFNGSVFSLATLPDGKILVGGSFTYIGDKPRNCLVQLESDGTLDEGFSPGVFGGTPSLKSNPFSQTANVHSLVVRADGKIVIGGAFTSIDGKARRGLALLNTDGSLDDGFVPDAKFNAPSPLAGPDYSLGQVLGLALQADSKVVVVGSFRDPSSPLLGSPVFANSIYRLDAKGGIDASFNPGGTGTDYTSLHTNDDNPFLSAVLIQPDGKIIIGGPIVGYNEHIVHLIARLDRDGKRDTTFNVGIGPVFSVFCLALEAGDKLLAGGSFVSVDQVNRLFIARFNTVAGVMNDVLVTIGATTKTAHETSLVKGKFTVVRSGGDPAANLNVRYSVSGTAVAGDDYDRLFGEVTIPGGSPSALIKVRPTGNTLEHGHRKVTVTLLPTAAYRVTAHPEASVIIAP